MGPDEKRKTPEYLAAKTAKTTIGPKTEDENPETPIMDGQPQALGRRRGSGLPHTGRIAGTCKPLRDPPRPWPLGVPLGLQTRALLARGGCGASRVLLPAVRRGARRCVGDRLAMMEMQLVIATVAQRFRFSPLGSRPIEPVVTLRPRYEVPLAIRAR